MKNSRKNIFSLSLIVTFAAVTFFAGKFGYDHFLQFMFNIYYDLQTLANAAIISVN